MLGLSFIGMAIWTLIPDKIEEEETQIANRFGVFGATLITFFLAEMGDKTQIATVAMAAHSCHAGAGGRRHHARHADCRRAGGLRRRQAGLQDPDEAGAFDCRRHFRPRRASRPLLGAGSGLGL